MEGEESVVDSFSWRWCGPAVLRVRSGYGRMSPRSPPQPGRARVSSPLHSGCVLRVKDHVISSNAEFARDSPSWGTVMALMGTEATHMAYSTCEAVVMAQMGPKRRTWRTQLAKLCVLAHGDIRAVRCEATHKGSHGAIWCEATHS